MEKLSDIYRLLKFIPNKNRSAPFWAWNDKLAPNELISQIRGMKEQGMGGFFIHSREGLETEYLSEDWMNCVEASINEAQKTGMETWIYDEDKWPSGSAGGMVSAADSLQFTAKALTAELVEFSPQNRDLILSELRQDENIIGIYLLSFEKEKHNFISSFIPFNVDKDLTDMNNSFSLLVCRMEISGNSEWYNGMAPSDNLNPQAVRCFLNLTHEKYKSRFGASFGKTVKGFFTDEPNFCDFFSHFTPGRSWLPWSIGLENYFQKKRGYSLPDILPLLFFNGRGEKKGRYDYWYTLTELFVESYTQQIYQWCEKNQLKSTGHMLYENDLGYSVRVSGASMPHYRYMHIPGIDILGDQRQEYLTVKQCTSVANQFDRKTVLSETYGCTGWDFSFSGQKRIGDWQFVMGVNRRSQHLSLYSLSGCRKRDYPPSFNYQTSWWPYNHILEDYFARLAICVTSGRVIRNILCLHPMGTLWMKSGSTIDEDLEHRQMNMGWLDDHILDLNKEGDQYNQLARSLLMSQFDFDFGDELIMKHDGSVVNSMLKIGTYSYRYLIIPRLETIMESTADLLEEFLDAGGTVFWVKPLPDSVDAVKSKRIKVLTEHKGVIVSEDYSELFSLLAVEVDRPLRICDEFGKDADGFLSMVREIEDGKIITVVNTSNTGSEKVVIHISDFGSLTSFDSLTNCYIPEKITLSQGKTGDMMTFRTMFNPFETKIFIVNKKEKPDLIEPISFYSHPHEVDQLIFSFSHKPSILLTMENALTLDRCCFRIEDELRSKETEVWQGQKTIRVSLSMRQIYYNGLPQRYRWIEENKEKKAVRLGMSFSFVVDSVPDGPVFVVIEKSQNFRVMCNAYECSVTKDYYLDKAMIKHRIPFIKTGENNLEIEVDYLESIELENIYIVGNFGVSPDRRIIKTPVTLQRGDWCFQGLYHYPGNVRYQYNLPPLDEIWKGKSLMLKLGAFAGILAVVRINNGTPLYAFQGQCKIPVDGLFMTNMKNIVEIEIVGSLRNLLGPFHRSSSVCSRISWEDFRTEGVAYTPEYSVEPLGIMGEISVIGGS